MESNLSPTELATLLSLDIDRRIVGGRKLAKRYLMDRGVYANAEALDSILDGIRTHPDRHAIEAEFCRLILDGDPT